MNDTERQLKAWDIAKKMMERIRSGEKVPSEENIKDMAAETSRELLELYGPCENPSLDDCKKCLSKINVRRENREMTITEYLEKKCSAMLWL